MTAEYTTVATITQADVERAWAMAGRAVEQDVTEAELIWAAAVLTLTLPASKPNRLFVRTLLDMKFGGNIAARMYARGDVRTYLQKRAADFSGSAEIG